MRSGNQGSWKHELLIGLRFKLPPGRTGNASPFFIKSLRVPRAVGLILGLITCKKCPCFITANAEAQHIVGWMYNVFCLVGVAAIFILSSVQASSRTKECKCRGLDDAPMTTPPKLKMLKDVERNWKNCETMHGVYKAVCVRTQPLIDEGAE